MNISQREPYQLSVSYLYDPISLDKVRLDVLKEDFSDVQYSPESELVYLASNEKNLRAQILLARLDYLDETKDQFANRSLDTVRVLLKALPTVNVKGFGVSLHMSAQVEGEKDAGVYVARHFLSAADALEQKLGAKIIAGASRITYGDVTTYFDLRITPAEISGETIHLHLRKHQDKTLSDCDRIFEETVVAQRDSVAELTRILDLI